MTLLLLVLNLKSHNVLQTVVNAGGMVNGAHGACDF